MKYRPMESQNMPIGSAVPRRHQIAVWVPIKISNTNKNELALPKRTSRANMYKNQEVSTAIVNDNSDSDTKLVPKI